MSSTYVPSQRLVPEEFVYTVSQRMSSLERIDRCARKVRLFGVRSQDTNCFLKLQKQPQGEFADIDEAETISYGT
jgi:hypothetical protein